MKPLLPLAAASLVLAACGGVPGNSVATVDGDPIVKPDYEHSWPVHCKVGTDGEAFHPNLDPQPFDAIFLKGEHAAAYSGFEGRAADGSALADWLQGHEITHVDVCGIATDYCVRATALDALREGFTVRVFEELCAGVAPGTSAQAIEELRAAGVAVV